ncbi:MAG: hypothetical protein IT442_06250 [Phycisphaeraceae bacterium]|nr:hypothetical protein [Phycisphaeraceae bacterium]
MGIGCEPVLKTERGRLLLRGGLALLAIAPFGYLGLILGVVSHEIVGHGLMSLAVGGEFLGFLIRFDGGGYAIVPLPEHAQPWQTVCVYFGGVAITSLLGMVILGAGWLCRRHAWVGLPLIVLAFAVLMEGIPYVFWNAVHPVLHGDIGRVLAIIDLSWLRVLLIVTGGVGLVAVTWTFTALLYSVLQGWLACGAVLENSLRLALLALLGLVPGLGWLIFDWDWLLPGIGNLPNISGLLLHLAAAASLAWIRLPPMTLRSHKGLVATLVTGWCMTAVCLIAIALWFHDGLVFADIQ